MPKRILKTTVLGRALGRAVPYVGWGLLIIDSIELIITEIKENNNNKTPFQVFGNGGISGGGGASGIW